jgi:putative DNA primase/helicase
MGPVARELLGEPNADLSSRDELRFGNRGSLSVDLTKGTFHDHEVGKGGGLLDLVQGQKRLDKDAAKEWLRQRGHISAAEPNNKPRIVATYDYVAATGEMLFQVVRFEPKDFRQRRPDGRGGWVWKMTGVQRVLYRLPKVIAAVDARRTIFIAEGEKGVHSLESIGLVGTCSPGGAGKWKPHYNSTFAGADVVVLPDNDPQATTPEGEPRWHPDGRPVLPGQDHAADVARNLSGTASQVRVVMLPDLPSKGDIADWVAAGGTREGLEALLPTSEPEAEPATSERSEPDEPPPDIEDPRSASKATIRVVAGKIDVLTDDAEDALLAAQAEVFQRAGHLVRPGFTEVAAADDRTTIAAGLHALKQSGLIEELARVAEWQKFDGRLKDWKRIDPPPSVAATLLERVGRWRLRSVAAIITCPTLRPDGSILSVPGYDAATRIYHMPDRTLRLPAPAARPSRDDALAAVAFLVDLLKGFPFVDNADRAVALSLIVSAVARGALGMVPVHAFTAPAPGTGKSYIADVVAAIVSGRWCPVITSGRTEEELEKRLGAMLLAGYPLISLDNMTTAVSGDALCQIAERPTVRIRILGKSETPECEFRGVVIANGNNLVVMGDMTRRVILGKLDAEVERPEERQFDFDPVKRILADRGQYIAAALTIVRAYLAAGQPDKRPALASYGAWSDLVRSALVWAGCADPVDTMKEIRESDPVLNTLRAVMECWCAVFDDEGKTVAEVAAEFAHGFDPEGAEGEAMTALRSALVPVAAVRNVIDAGRLGYWLRASKGRPAGNLKFSGTTGHGGAQRWSVVKV